jgi:hypothetical protein
VDFLPRNFKVKDPLICYSTVNKKSRVSFQFQFSGAIKKRADKIV